MKSLLILAFLFCGTAHAQIEGEWVGQFAGQFDDSLVNITPGSNIDLKSDLYISKDSTTVSFEKNNSFKLSCSIQAVDQKGAKQTFPVVIPATSTLTILNSYLHSTGSKYVVLELMTSKQNKINMTCENRKIGTFNILIERMGHELKVKTPQVY